MLSNCCTNTMSIISLKLKTFKGSLAKLAKSKPSLYLFFIMAKYKPKFKFFQPGPITGVKSKDKALMKMSKCTFTYPVNDTPTLFDMRKLIDVCRWGGGVVRPDQRTATSDVAHMVVPRRPWSNVGGQRGCTGEASGE